MNSLASSVAGMTLVYQGCLTEDYDSLISSHLKLSDMNDYNGCSINYCSCYEVLSVYCDTMSSSSINSGTSDYFGIYRDGILFNVGVYARIVPNDISTILYGLSELIGFD